MTLKELVFDPIKDPKVLSLIAFDKYALDKFDIVTVNSKVKNEKILLCLKLDNILFIKHPDHPVNLDEGISGRLNWIIQWAWINNLNFLLVYSSELTKQTVNETFASSFMKCAGREYPYKFRLK